MLVATDFDGTLAPIVARPEAAAPLPEALAALSALAALRDVRVAVVSGRALSDLRARCPVPGCWYLGGHGNEISPALSPPETDPAAHGRATTRAALAKVAERLRRRLPEWPGVRLEAKPFSLALHFRQAPQWADPIRDAVSALAAKCGLRVMFGRQIAELLPEGALNKGQAVQRLRRLLGCDLAFYFGDDTTDEDVFRLGNDRIIGVRVRHAETDNTATAAQYWVASPHEVAAALAAVGAARSDV